MSKIAVIQHPSVLLDRGKTIQKAVDLVNEAAANAAELVIFPEAYIAGYPSWVWRLRPGGDWDLSAEIHHRLLHSAVNLQDDDINPLCDAAKKHQITIVCGLNEREDEFSRATLYNTVIVINTKGKIINRHRKLMPTNPERMIWGFGDASGLKVVETPVGRLGTLICWENFMPLARYALYAQGIELYIAPSYDSGDGWLGTLQHIAREGCCWVIGSGVVLRNSDIPDDFPEKTKLFPDEDGSDAWINPGDSVVIAPGGEIVQPPLHNEKGIIYAVIDIESVAKARRCLDVAGHYSRADIFQLHVNMKPQNPVSFD